MTHMICIRMLSQILDSADTTRFLDLFRIPVSRAEFDDSNKHSFFLTFSPRIHTFFSINSSHFSPRSPRIGAARPEMLIQIFVHFDKENPEGIWTLVDYERTLGCGVWVGCRRPEIGTGWGMAWGMGLGQSSAVSIWRISWRLYLQDSLKNIGCSSMPQIALSECSIVTNQGAAPCLRLSGKPRCTYDSNQPGILATRHWPSLQGRNMPSRLQSWILVGTCQTPSTMSWPSSVFGQIA